MIRLQRLGLKTLAMYAANGNGILAICAEAALRESECLP